MRNCPTCSGLGVATRCEYCAGAGFYVLRSNRESIQAHAPALERCTVCNGAGHVPISLNLAISLGFVYVPEDPHAPTANHTDPRQHPDHISEPGSRHIV